MEETRKLSDKLPEISVDEVTQVFLPAASRGADFDCFVRHKGEDGTLLGAQGEGMKALCMTPRNIVYANRRKK